MMGKSTYQAAVARLNSNQRNALEESGNTVLLAGPGSGKTATLVLKIARLLDQIPAPRGLACLTYGNEAAREFEKRLDDLGIGRGGRLFTGTVHSFCLTNVLRPFAGRLPSRMAQIAQHEVASDDDTAWAREKGLALARVNEPEGWWATKISAYRRIVCVDGRRRKDFDDDRLPLIADGYEKALRERQKIDFDDIVLAALRLIEEDAHVRRVLAAKYPWLVVDEYQDLGLALHQIVVTMMEKAGVHVFAVGDPDQSIYGFTGARPEFLDNLAQRDDVRAIRLKLNYRCLQRIIDASLHILQPTEEREFTAAQNEEESKGEIMFHRSPRGLSEQATTVVDRIRTLIAEQVAPGDIGILATRWQDLRDFEQLLGSEQIPYRIAKTKTYKATPLTMWIEGMVAWCAGGWRMGTPRLADLYGTWERICSALLGVSSNERNLGRRIELHSTLRVHRDPQIEVGTWVKSVANVLRLYDLVTDVSAIPLRIRHDVHELGVMLRTLSGSRQPIAEFSGFSRDKVVLQSIHASKGLEYTAVFIPALEEGVLPKWGDDIREARRLFYVALTRARHTVHLLWSGFFYTTKGERRDKGPSPFIRELMFRLSS